MLATGNFPDNMKLADITPVFKKKDLSSPLQKEDYRPGVFHLLFQTGVVFAGGREMKIFITVFRDFGKNIVGKRYFQH